MNRVNVGEKYGRLEVISEVFVEKGRKKVRTVCTCGDTRTVSVSNLIRGHTQSCGCLREERKIKAATKHGYSKTPLRKIHNNMMSRCYNPKATGYEYYGGKGITVCKEWHELKGFGDWATSIGYREGLSIERINVSQNYEPNNCTWIKKNEQSINQSISINNKSGYPGVFFDKSRGKYTVSASENGKSIYLGRFVSKEDAVATKRKDEVARYGRVLYKWPFDNLDEAAEKFKQTMQEGDYAEEDSQ